MYGCEGKVLSDMKTHAPMPILNTAIGKAIIGVGRNTNNRFIKIRKIKSISDSYILSHNRCDLVKKS